MTVSAFQQCPMHARTHGRTHGHASARTHVRTCSRYRKGCSAKDSEARGEFQLGRHRMFFWGASSRHAVGPMECSISESVTSVWNKQELMRVVRLRVAHSHRESKRVGDLLSLTSVECERVPNHTNHKNHTNVESCQHATCDVQHARTF